MSSDLTNAVVLSVSSLVALLLAVPLWRKPGHAAGKVAWTALLAVPVLGPVFFAVLHDPPPPKAGCGCGSGGCETPEDGGQVGGSLADALRDDPHP